MSTTVAGAQQTTLVAHWRLLVLRGVAAILFGVLVVVAPALSVAAMVILWTAYVLTHGLFNLTLAARTARTAQTGGPRGWLLVEGTASVAAGALTCARPGLTPVTLVAVIAVWSVATGVVEVGAALRLRRSIPDEWLLGASGVVSIAFGLLLLLIVPAPGPFALGSMLSVYAIVTGALVVGLGLRLGQEAPTDNDDNDDDTGGRRLAHRGPAIRRHGL